MAYPSGSARVVLRGQVTDGEFFETTFGLSNVLVANPADGNVLAARIALHFNNDLSAAAAQMMSTDQSFTTLLVYYYPAGGSHAAFIGTAPISSVGLGTVQGALQQACVCTLNTGLAGRRNRGRMYFPASGTILVAGHWFSTTRTAALATALATFLTSVGADLTASATPSVLSLTGSSAQVVTQVAVDQRPDVQRRRANKQPGGTTSVATVT